MIRAGDGLRTHSDFRHLEDHRWIVLSDPVQDEKGFLDKGNALLIVSFTTWKDYKDPTCIVEAKQYAELTDRSCIAYWDIRATTVAHLDLCKKQNLLVSIEPVSAELLKEIREGAVLSEETAPDFKRMLIAQNLFDQEFIEQNPVE